MPAKGSYAIRAEKTGYTFSPAQHAVIVPAGVSNPLIFAATINP
jgi:hypothetical protein